MKRLAAIFLVLALLLGSVGVAFAWISWDGDPVLDVGGTKVHVSFNIGDGAFVRNGGQIALTAMAPKIRLLAPGPKYVKTTVVQGNCEGGDLCLTVTLSGATIPDSFLVRVRVPNKGFERIYSTSSGKTVVVDLP